MVVRDRNTENGFTLVELMVVVLIIGILVALAIPVFASAQEKVEERTCYSNQRTIEGAVQQWIAGDPSRVVGDLAGVVDDASPLVPSFISSPPHCPSVTSASYSLDTSGVVQDCPNGALGAHGHY